MTEPAPTFEIDQPDGTRVAVDLSAPGEMGDFAFRVTGEGRSDYFYAYHLYEPRYSLTSSSRSRATATPPTC